MKVIEVDMDGVCVDIYSYIEEKVKSEGYKDFTFDNIKTYNMVNSGIGCPRVVIQKYFFDEKVFEECTISEQAIEFFKWVNTLEDTVLVIHSHATKSEILDAKREIVKVLDEEGIIYKLQLDSTPMKRMLKDSYIVIEDSLDNLYSSTADIKILFKQHHNKRENNQNFEDLYEELYMEAIDFTGIKENLIRDGLVG
jgi:5'(3')-deoxyribonucleotidase